MVSVILDVMHSVICFFNDTATTEIYTLSLHDALPICSAARDRPRSRSTSPSTPGRSTHARWKAYPKMAVRQLQQPGLQRDRKSTRLNSSHANISYAVFCLK